MSRPKNGYVKKVKVKRGPLRSLLAWGYYGGPVEGARGTATWESTEEGWRCISATIMLKWLVGGPEGKEVDGEMRRRGMRWEWLPKSGMPRCWR